MALQAEEVIEGKRRQQGGAGRFEVPILHFQRWPAPRGYRGCSCRPWPGSRGRRAAWAAVQIVDHREILAEIREQQDREIPARALSSASCASWSFALALLHLDLGLHHVGVRRLAALLLLLGDVQKMLRLAQALLGVGQLAAAAAMP